MAEQKPQDQDAEPLRQIITFCDDTNPFCCPRQQVDGNTEYLKIIIRTYGKTLAEFTDQVLFTGDRFNEGAEHNEKRGFLCQCPRCAKYYGGGPKKS